MAERIASAPAPVAALVRFKRLAERDRLRELREGLGLTQVDVASVLGVAPSQVSRWERGLHRPSPELVVRLLDLLDGESE